MTPKGNIIILSLAGSAALAGCWMFMVKISESRELAPPVKPKVTRVASKGASGPTPSSTGKLTEPAVARSFGDHTQVPPVPAVNPVPPAVEELAGRATRVEQEANHDLRRLVRLLDLNEEQQDRVFQTLAEHSPSWTPGLQIATAGAVTAGKRSTEALSTAPETGTGTYSKKPAAASETPAAAGSSKTAENTSDPMAEILALLDPGQQDILLKEEMDRAAWWAEILPQITPPDDVPAIDGSAGQTKAYDGAEVLE